MFHNKPVFGKKKTLICIILFIDISVKYVDTLKTILNANWLYNLILQALKRKSTGSFGITCFLWTNIIKDSVS